MEQVERLLYKIMSDDLKTYFQNISSISMSLDELVKMKKEEMRYKYGGKKLFEAMSMIKQENKDNKDEIS